MGTAAVGAESGLGGAGGDVGAAAGERHPGRPPPAYRPRVFGRHISPSQRSGLDPCQSPGPLLTTPVSAAGSDPSRRGDARARSSIG